MDEVGGGGPVGIWDQALFDRFRAAAKGRRTKVGRPLDPAGALRRRLKEELLRIHTPLVRRLVDQVQGNAPPERLRGRFRAQMHLVGAKDIEWDVAFNLGLFAASKGLETLDLSQGSWPSYLVKKVFYELQCEVGRMNMIKVDRGARPMAMEYLEDDEQLGRLDQEEEPDEEAPQTREIEEKEERTGQLAPLVPASVLASAAVAIPLVVVPIVDLRIALDVFLEDHCRFAPNRRAAATQVQGRYHGIAHAHGEMDVHAVLAAALRSHGVTPTTMRVAWCETPVRGLAGVCLQSTAERASAGH